ncbi:MAG: PKD domain-containing protein [Candidatus Thiodiazotropha sp.]
MNTNQAPFANAGADQTINAGETIQLDGSGSSDSDGSIVRYSWYQNRGPAVDLQGRTTATPSFVMPANAELAFTLSVIDDSGSVGRDSVLIRSAVNTNQAPFANAGADQTNNAGETIQLDGSGSSDPDGNVTKYIWTQISGPTIELNNRYSVSPLFDASNPGETVLRLVVEDDRGSRSFDDVLISVVDVTTLPPVAIAGDDGAGVEGSIFHMDGGQSIAPDGTISSYHWEQISGPATSVWTGSLNSATVGVRLPEVEQDTLIGFRLTVTNDLGISSSDELTILVLENLPPEPIPFPEQTIVEGDYYVMDATSLFRVQPGDSIALASYRWAQLSGPQVTLQYKQYREQARILAPEVDVMTPLVFEVTAADRSGVLGRNTITLNVIRREDMPDNILPHANAGEDRVSISNHYIVVDGSGSVDPDGTIVSYSWEIVDSPPNPAISFYSFRGDNRYSTAYIMPTNYTDNNVAGDYTIRLTVTDDRGGTSTDEVIVTLNPDVNIGEVPIANAGSDRRIAPHYFDHDDRLRLYSNDSSDSDGTIETIHWQQVNGPKVDLFGSGFSPLPIHGDVRYEFLLTVVDDQGNQDDDLMYWSVGYTNSLPRAVFTQPQVVALSGGTLQLDGSGSYDNDDYIASFNWSQIYGPDVLFLDNSSEPVIQLPIVDSVSRVKIGLSVTDLSGAESNIVDEERFWIVSPDYNSNIISAGDDVTVFSGDSLELIGEVLLSQECDPLGGCTNYGEGLRWYQLGGPPLINPIQSGRSFTFETPQVEERTSVTLALVDVFNAASFGLVALAADPVEVNLLPVTQGLSANAGADQQAFENSQIIFDGSASSGQNGTIVQYHWEQLEGPMALLVSPYEALTEVYLPAVANETDLLFLLTVVDDTGLEAFDIIRVSVTPDLTDGDIDADGVVDVNDLFPHNSQDAYDVDGDGIGDNSDIDRDGDGVNNDADYYPNDSEISMAPEIIVYEPLDGTILNKDYVIVKGTVDDSPNIGITINGIVAERANGPNGSEFAARIPLVDGGNELTITATTLAGKQISQSLTVTREGEDPVKFFVTDNNGIAPFTNTLNFTNSSSTPVSQIEIDYEGDGVYDETLVNDLMDDIYYQYEITGLYYPQVRFTDSNGLQYIATQIVNVVSQQQIDEYLQEIWGNMNLALTQGNHGLAADYLFEGSRKKYSKIYYLLLPYFSEIVQSYSSLQLYKIYPNYASYVINRDIEGADRAFIISFVKDDTGLWRVSSM